MRYLDPKADLTFKKVFGENKELVISLLNALLPLPEDGQVESVEYLASERIPDNPWRRYSIVDVLCVDARKQIFRVELQMVWSSEFKLRVQWDADKAYVRQAVRGGKYEQQPPVYSVSLVNETLEPDTPEFYHYYPQIYEHHTDRLIYGLHLIFVELPKFKVHKSCEKEMLAYWLRYFTEISEETKTADAELLANSYISQALEALENIILTPAQMAGYEKFWDVISVERTLASSGERKGYAKGLEKGKSEAMMEMATQMKADGVPLDTIMKYTGLPEKAINDL